MVAPWGRLGGGVSNLSSQVPATPPQAWPTLDKLSSKEAGWQHPLRDVQVRGHLPADTQAQVFLSVCIWGAGSSEKRCGHQGQELLQPWGWEDQGSHVLRG